MTIGTLLTAISLVWIVSEILLARIKHSDRTGANMDKSSLRLLWTTIVISIVLGILLSAYRIGTITAGSTYYSISGLILIVAGLILRWTAILTLRKYFTVDVSITKDHNLVITGVYRYIRHPANTGSLLSFLGLGLTFSNVLSLLVIIVPITVAFMHRITIEEKVLTEYFGNQYKQYCAATKRLIPGIY